MLFGTIKHSVRYSTISLVMFILAFASLRVNAQESLKLLYESRPILFVKNPDGKLVGALVHVIAPAMKLAGIPFHWVEVPFNRQLKIIEMNSESVCAAGLYMTPERKKFAKFSRSIMTESEEVTVLISHQDVVLPNSLDLLAVLSLPNVSLLVKENTSYGRTVDDYIARSKVNVILTNADPRTMTKMIGARRADFLMAGEQEAQQLVESVEGGAQLKIYRPTGQTSKEERYLMCSKRVPEEIIERFNRALPR